MADTVLVPVDGSQRSEEAFEYALETYPDASIIVLYVLNPVNMVAYSDDEDGFFDVDAYERAVETRQDDAEEMMDRYREAAADAGGEVETVVEKGDPAKVILRTAEDRSVDHIVMGSRGRSGFGRVLFGSVAEAVTRRAPVPVTIVR